MSGRPVAGEGGARSAGGSTGTSGRAAGGTNVGGESTGVAGGSSNGGSTVAGGAGGSSSGGSTVAGGAGGSSSGGSTVAGGAGGGSVVIPNAYALGSGQVELFVNGVLVGSGAAPDTLLSARANLNAGAENVIAFRATRGSASRPFVAAELDGAFGRVGTGNQWKVKAATSAEAAGPAGPWATSGYDDGAWARATEVNGAVMAPFPSGGPARGLWSVEASDADINPQVVWGGDAITIDDADNVWIDHNRFSLIGRQMIVTGFGKASNATFSWNEFDGRTPYAAYCDGAHYWVLLLLGAADTLTMQGNWIHDSSGRAPHAGGYDSAHVTVHLVNNYFDHITGHAVNPLTTQARLLLEANYFRDVTTPILPDTTTAPAPGYAFAPIGAASGATDAACTTAIRRNCVANIAAPQSGTWLMDQAVLDTFSTVPRDARLTPYPASEVPRSVPSFRRAWTHLTQRESHV